jgi:transcriptional regulator with XRE-family HTH domain
MRGSASPGMERVLFVSGGELAALRRSQGLSQSDLSELSGLHRNTVQKVEAGCGDSSILAMSLMQIFLRASGVNVEREGFFPCPPPAEVPDYPYAFLILRPPVMIAAMGRMIRRRRTERGMSLSGLADSVGVHRNTIWNVERGLVAPASSTIYAIYRGLGVRWVGGSDKGLIVK